MLRYSSGGYHYKQSKCGRIVRIAAPSVAGGGGNYTGDRPCVGDVVKIIVKPYHMKNYLVGKVARVLTKKQYHSRGHKVRLESGKVGRIISFVKKAK